MALYARVSTPDQVEADLPIQGQVEALRTFAIQRGYSVFKEYIDAGLSAFRSMHKRHALADLLEDAKAGYFEVVAVWKLDRLARNLKDAMVFLGELGSYGVELVSVTEFGVQDHNASNVLSRNILLAFAEHFSRQHGENVKRGMRATWTRGGCLNRSPPYGYGYSGGNGGDRNLTPNPTEEAVVRAIYAMAARNLSLPQIAKRLETDGVFPRKSRHWARETLRHILRSETYLGNRVGKFGRQEKVHHPLIDRETWERAQEMITARKRILPHPRMHSSSFMLSAVASCGLCGARVRGITHGHPYYICSTRARYSSKACPLKPIGRDILHEIVFPALSNQLMDPTGLSRLIQEQKMRRDGRPANMVVAIQGLLRRQRLVLDLIEKGGDAKKTRFLKIRRELEALEDRVEETENQKFCPTNGELSQAIERMRPAFTDYRRFQADFIGFVRRIIVSPLDICIQATVPLKFPITVRINLARP